MQHECFLLTSVILFLNKRDLFAEKIDIVPLSIAYPDFGGPQGYQPALHYIRKKFLRLNKTPEKNIYVHVTCATDTQQVQVVLDSTFDTIITRNMQRSGLM
uniref:Uncharacterized protein n=1 Tax=Plectus sambesii TaxID=2011161 RepID=A0A914WRJ5_9BILA